MFPLDAAWLILKNEQRFEHIGRYSERDVGLLHYPSSVDGEIRSMPFYRSSGINSGEPGSWKFFHGVTTHPQETKFHSGETGDIFQDGPAGETFLNEKGKLQQGRIHEGWMIKPQVANHAFEYDHSQGARYGHAKVKQLSEWMDENVKDMVYDAKDMEGAQINQHLRDKNAFGMHDMAQGIQPQQQQPQPQPQQQWPAGSLQAQAQTYQQQGD